MIKAVIFDIKETLNKCEIPDINKAKHAFYSFFRNETSEYPETKIVLMELKEIGKIICTLSDVAYGMDNKYVLDDIKGLLKYIDFPLTSIDTGFRKPNPKGLFILAEQMSIGLDEILFAGDEEKDIKCAKKDNDAYIILIYKFTIYRLPPVYLSLIQPAPAVKRGNQGLGP